MNGIFDDVITANRDLVRQFTYIEISFDAFGGIVEGDPIDLSDYTRLIYNLQTKKSTPTEILTVDSNDVDQAGWLQIASPASDGIIDLQVPGTALAFTASDSLKWEHELILLDDNGGILEFFRGNVVLKKPVTYPLPA